MQSTEKNRGQVRGIHRMVGIPIAGAAMAFSSVSVVTNALRLRHLELK